MSADLLNEKDSIEIADEDHDAEVVAPNIKYDAVAGKKVRRSKTILDVLRCFPFGSFRLV